MRKLFLTILALVVYCNAFSTIKIKLGISANGETKETELQADGDIELLKTVTDLKAITFSSTLASGNELRIIVNNETTVVYAQGEGVKSLTFTNNVMNKEILIELWSTSGAQAKIESIKFRIVNTLDPAVPKPGNTPVKGSGSVTPKTNTTACGSCLIKAFVEQKYNDEGKYTRTPFGIYEHESRTIHIFFDQNGNSLLTTIPQGISNAKYIVHVVYAFYSKDPSPTSYSVKQKSGSFSSALLFDNSNITKPQLQSGSTYDNASESTFLLGTATDNLSFDIVATKDDGSNVTKTVLENYTIKMSPVYHGSFDVGLIRTNLVSPTFSNLSSSAGSTMVVKETDASSRGVVTLMASYYASPIVMLRSLLKGKKNDVPFYKLNGRNFLDDHKFYERIYPAIGVSISSRTFENLFYGFNLELARGLNLFGGWHYGKVNTFEMPGYQAGITPVSPEQFEFYRNTKWKNSSAFGVKIDAVIFRTLFGTGVN